VVDVDPVSCLDPADLSLFLPFLECPRVDQPHEEDDEEGVHPSRDEEDHDWSIELELIREDAERGTPNCEHNDNVDVNPHFPHEV